MPYKKDSLFVVKCPSCKKERQLSYKAYWYINKHPEATCKFCRNPSLEGLKKGQGWNKGLKGFRKGHPAYIRAIGKDNPFYGKTHTSETREKMRQAKLGKVGNTLGKKWKVSPESLKNFGKQRGSLHYNWKGGITSLNRQQRAAFRYSLQKLIFERDGYKCQICESSKDLQVDHIQSWAEFKELRFDPDNCRTLCAKCHYKITYGKEMPKDTKAWGHNLRKVGY